MQTSGIQTVKNLVSEVLNLSKDALHIYVGLGVFLIMAALLNKSPRSLVPWIGALIAAIIGEMVDGYDDLVLYGRWRWPASLHDVINTLFWPTVLVLLARFNMFFGGAGNRRY